MKIALDAMGGDEAPEALVTGAKLALEISASKCPNLQIILFGPKSTLEPHFEQGLPERLEFYDISDSESSSDDPHIAGADPDSIIRTALRKHREGFCDAVVSAGPTGAQVLASLLELEKCSGITRPAVGAALPALYGCCYLIDVGASLVASAHHLVQFAAMGIIYAREILNIAEPRVGLLNVGVEEQIGERNVIEAYRLLTESGFLFVGNVEGCDVLKGKAEVIVTNGFTGNVLLKFLEGVPEFLTKLLKPAEDERLLNHLDRQLDYQQFGGEPLLGIRGVSIICHGASSPRAIASAILRAAMIVEKRLPEKIESFLEGKFTSYFSRIKYLRSFRRGLRT
ncbi:MAG: phosphate acyltransferase [Calditrichaeota bacterium]|nr:phosphate acyltransferase [Calditrichota bacterium]